MYVVPAKIDPPGVSIFGGRCSIPRAMNQVFEWEGKLNSPVVIYVGMEVERGFCSKSKLVLQHNKTHP